MSTLAAVVLTYNEENHIADCLATLQWADSIIVYDSFSSDRTVERAQAAGAQVLQHRFENYGAQRDAALAATDSDWVLFVDADERVSPALAAEIRGCLDQPQRGWYLPRHNYIFGRLTLGAGWYPDYQMRLLYRSSARYDPARPVHEEVLLEGDAGYLNEPLIHLNYRDPAHFREKQARYSEIEARNRFAAGLRPRPWTWITMPLRQFLWRYLTLKGYRDGLHGLHLSMLMAWYEFDCWRHVSRLRRGEPA